MTAFTLEIRKYQNSRLSYVVLGLAGFLSLWLAILVIIGAARCPRSANHTDNGPLQFYRPHHATHGTSRRDTRRAGGWRGSRGTHGPVLSGTRAIASSTVLDQADAADDSRRLCELQHAARRDHGGGACRPRGRSFIRRVLLACRRPDAGSYTRGQCSPVGFG